MPELPEVETVREGVHHHAVGCVIERVRILDERSIRRHIGGSADFTMRLEPVFAGHIGAASICGSRSLPLMTSLPRNPVTAMTRYCRTRLLFIWG